MLRRSLTLQQTVVLAVTALVILGCASIIQVANMVDRERTRIDELRNEAIDLVEGGLGQAVWQFDERTGQEILNGILRLELVRRIEVRDRQDSIFIAAGADATAKPDWLGTWLFGDLATMDRELSARVHIQSGDEEWSAGTIHLELDLGQAAAAFRHYVAVRLLQTTIVLLLLSVAVWIVLDRLLTRHLRRLSAELAALDPDNPGDGILTTAPMHASNELGQLVGRVNGLLRRVAEARALREEIIRREYERSLLSQVNERLEVEVSERTRQLHIEKNSAESASRAKSIFLANMSHELRTPLNGVMGYAQVIRDEVLGPIQPVTYRAYGGYIYESGHHMLGLVEEILSLSATEFGQLALEEEEFEVDTEVGRAVSPLRPQAEKRRIDLVFHVPGQVIRLMADPLRFRQMVVNLVTNAVKYSPSGSRVEIHAYVDDSGRACVAVEDNGSGIAPERLDKVSEPFATTDDPMRTTSGGLGLGLALTKRIMAAHDGELRLHSTVGKGTMAVLVFPQSRVTR